MAAIEARMSPWQASSAAASAATDSSWTSPEPSGTR